MVHQGAWESRFPAHSGRERRARCIGCGACENLCPSTSVQRHLCRRAPESPYRLILQTYEREEKDRPPGVPESRRYRCCRNHGGVVSAASPALREAPSRQTAHGRPAEMTYRTNPKTGDRVSLLGYGCMRWPTVSATAGRRIDQEMVNALVDHAIAHGVNYFDTSPAYCRGRSEHATGVALSRHPRDKYFIATKLSNFAPSTWSREASMAMYRNSFQRAAGRLYRLPAAARRGHGQRHGGVRSPLHRQRDAGFPACRA